MVPRVQKETVDAGRRTYRGGISCLGLLVRGEIPHGVILRECSRSRHTGTPNHCQSGVEISGSKQTLLLFIMSRPVSGKMGVCLYKWSINEEGDNEASPRLLNVFDRWPTDIGDVQFLCGVPLWRQLTQIHDVRLISAFDPQILQSSRFVAITGDAVR